MADYESHVLLRDGSTLRLRSLDAGDVQSLMRFYSSLSDETLYMRFFIGTNRLSEKEAESLIVDDPAGNFAIVGVVGNRIVADARYYRHPDDPARAEVAVTIADDLQGRGLGTQLIQRLAEVAREAGIQTFDADVLGDNHIMLEVLDNLGFRTSRRVERGVVHAEIHLQPTPGFQERWAARSREAAVASLHPFFEPRGIAIVGASRRSGKIGTEILQNLIDGPFNGAIHPVHPVAEELCGLPAHPSVAACPGPVDLAILAIPAPAVVETVEACIDRGVRAILVISAGFSEIGDEGQERERALIEQVRRAGIRLIGPNCVGIMNTDPDVRLNATFAPVAPPVGNVAFATQSGALGIAILEHAQRLGVGLSSFVSLGNKPDVSGNDLLQYWAADERTDVILLYLESFGNPRIFSRLTRRIAREKPIVAVKSGRSTAGARAASSHTGAMATDDRFVDALFHQAGILRTDTLEELFDLTMLLSRQPIPAGPGLAILTNAGGPAIMATDACEGAGLTVPPLAGKTVRALSEFLPPVASPQNPVDMNASATPEQYERAIPLLLGDAAIDALLVIFIPPLVTPPEAVARAVARGVEEAGVDKPVVASFVQTAGPPTDLGSIPSYPFPESAVRALGKAAAYGRWLTRPANLEPPDFPDIDRARARTVKQTVLERGGGWLHPEEGRDLCRAFGLPAVDTRGVEDLDDAIETAFDLGFPVALKAVGPTILHKTDVGGVALDLDSPDALRAAWLDMEERLEDAMTGGLLQPMMTEGIEVLIGVIHDPLFGPLIAYGSGGIEAELYKDVTFRLHPVDEYEVREMLEEVRGSRRLRGYRDQPPGDEEALVEALLRLSLLVESCPEIREVDINPLRVLSEGAIALDVRIRMVPTSGTHQTLRVVY